MFAEEIARATRRLANVAGAETGAVSFFSALLTTTPIDGFACIALGGGTFLGKPFVPRESDGEPQHERREKRFSATCHGFDGHGEVRIAADDDEGRERLLRTAHVRRSPSNASKS